MYLQSIEINNFRSFYGNHRFDFKSSDINLIFGKNGSGKSNLINAISWCLYGSEILESSSQSICNYTMVNDVDIGDKIQVYVICRFVDDKNIFEFRREAYFYKNESNNRIMVADSNFDILFDNGKHISPFLHQDLVINRYFPIYLFSSLLLDDNDVDVSFKDIKRIYYIFNGLDILDETNSHLDKLLHSYKNDLRKENSKHEGYELLSHRKDEIEEDYKKINMEIDKNSDELFKCEQELSEIENKLSNYLINHGNVDYVENRNKISNELKFLRDRLANLEKEKTKLIVKLFPIIVSLSSINSEINIDNLKKELFENGNFKDIRFYEGYLNIPVLFDESDNVIRLINLSKEIYLLLNEISKKYEQLEEINHILSDIGDINFNQLKHQSDVLKKLKSNLTHKSNILEQRKKHVNTDLNSIKREQARFKKLNIASDSIHHKIDFCQELIDVGELTMKKLADCFLKDFSNIINDIFIETFEMNNKFQKIIVDDSSEIKLIDNFGQKISVNDLSFGEKKLMRISLIFTFTKCFELEYPIILFNPFNNLDSENSDKILSFILKNRSEQNILLIMNEDHHVDNLRDNFNEYELIVNTGDAEVKYHG